MSLINLGLLGDFLGGIFGSVFSFVTIIFLLLDRKENKKNNQFDSALKLFEFYRIVLDEKDKEIFYDDQKFLDKSFVRFVGVEDVLIHLISEGVESLIHNTNNYYILLWLENYTNCMALIYKSIKDFPILLEMYSSHYHKKYKLIQRLIVKLNHVYNRSEYANKDHILNKINDHFSIINLK